MHIENIFTDFTIVEIFLILLTSLHSAFVGINQYYNDCIFIHGILRLYDVTSRDILLFIAFQLTINQISERSYNNEGYSHKLGS